MLTRDSHEAMTWGDWGKTQGHGGDWIKGGVTGIDWAQHTYVHTTYYIRSAIHIMAHFYTQTVVKEGMCSLDVGVGTD